jgi:hypothetical protein
MYRVLHHLRGPVGEAGLFQLEDDAAEGVLFLAASDEPDVVLAHRLPGPGRERALPFVEELGGALSPCGEFGQEGDICGEFGVRHARSPRTGAWEVEDIPEPLRDHCSRRAAQVDAIVGADAGREENRAAPSGGSSARVPDNVLRE